MNEGWVKVYRKLADNDILYDDKALRIFMWLLLNVDRKTGTITLGRYQGAFMTKMPPSTFRDALLRMTKKYKITTTTSDSKKTLIRLLNWDKYQAVDKETTTTDDKTTTATRQQPDIQDDTITRSKELRIKNITNVIQKVEYGDPLINESKRYFLEKFQLPKEDCTELQCRRYWSLLLKESKTGIEGVKFLVDTASQDDFYRNNITSSKDLYYKRVKIIARKRGSAPLVASFKTGGMQ